MQSEIHFMVFEDIGMVVGIRNFNENIFILCGICLC